MCWLCGKNNFANPLPPLEQDPDALCILHSSLLDKDKDGSFSDAIKIKMCNNDYDFTKVIFPGVISFENFNGENKAIFNESIFLKDAIFKGITFECPVDFREVEFCGLANFEKSIFNKHVNFMQVKFFGGADFSFAKFNYETKSISMYSLISIGCDFNNVQFHKKCNFSCALFKCATSFIGVNIFCGAAFNQTTFEDYFGFQSITSNNYINFMSSEFFGNATFSHLMTDKFYFNGARVFGKMNFDLFYSLESNKKKPINAEFFSVLIEPNAIVKFSKSTLAKIQLSGTNLRQISFHEVKWHQYFPQFFTYFPRFIKKMLSRQTVYDEIVLRTNKQGSYEEIERLYRDLKVNYEEKKDFQRMGDFHYGEMEMHRLGSPWRRRFPLSWYNLYWALNGYGERPLRALTWFGVFLFAFTGLIWSQGLTATGFGQPADFRQSFRFVLEKATFQRPEWAKPVTELGQWIANSIVLVIPGQLALFFLALRNRLGRRR